MNLQGISKIVELYFNINELGKLSLYRIINQEMVTIIKSCVQHSVQLNIKSFLHFLTQLQEFWICISCKLLKYIRIRFVTTYSEKYIVGIASWDGMKGNPVEDHLKITPGDVFDLLKQADAVVNHGLKDHGLKRQYDRDC